MTDTPVISNPASFHAEARYQGVCAVCERPGPFEAHHVVPRRLLKRLGLPLHDTRGALRLCNPPGMGGCHMQYEWGGVNKIEVPITRWKQQNVCYVFETLGVTAVQLEGKSGPLDIDPRWTAHLEGGCEHCQCP